jgi:hypothetical protein
MRTFLLLSFAAIISTAVVAGGQTPAQSVSGLPAPAVQTEADQPHLRVVFDRGRVWVSADGVSLAEVLGEYGRLANVRIETGAGLPAAPISIELAGAPEQEALATLLRGAAGFVLVPRPTAAGPAESQFARVVIVSNAAASPARTAAAMQPSPPAVVTSPAAPAAAGSFPVAPGVNRLIGADGQPIPDDQEVGPIVQPIAPASPQGKARRRPGGI